MGVPKPPIVPLAPGGFRCLVYDIEVFPNYFCAIFTDGRKWWKFRHTHLKDLAEFVEASDLVLAGFNNFDYDDIMLRFICSNPQATTQEIYEYSCKLIAGADEDFNRRAIRAQYTAPPWAYSIDFFKLVNKKGSLKEWECVTGFPSVEDSPKEFNERITAADVPLVEEYCMNDVSATATQLVAKWELINIRERLDKQFGLGVSIYTKSEAQVAEHVYVSLYQKRTGLKKSVLKQKMENNPDNKRTSFPLTEIVAKQVQFATAPFQQFLKTYLKGSVKKINAVKWGLEVPGIESFDAMKFGDLTYALGVGGIHSVDEPLIIEGTKTHAIIDLDVTSYYPNLMITQNMFPMQLGEAFLKDFTMLKDMRVAAKKAGDKAINEALKIVINGTFGKLNDTYSPIRSTPHAHRVTVNGQLFILMLIEAFISWKIRVLSANTDGVTIFIERSKIKTVLASIVDTWQKRTKMELEQVEYSRFCRRDVNNYVAKTVEGKIKRKGCFAIEPPGLAMMLKADGMIIRNAAEEFLLNGTKPEETVGKCDDPRKFLFYARVKNGGDAYYGNRRIGKTVRWYASIKGEMVKRVNPKGKKVKESKLPSGDRAQLAMNISGWDVCDILDCDTAYYVSEAYAMANSCIPKVKK